MSTKFTVEVTEYDIRTGIRQDPSACPIAIALERAGCDYPSVEYDKVRWLHIESLDDPASPMRDLTALLPPAAADFIDRFDHGLRVVPITFELEFQPREHFND